MSHREVPPSSRRRRRRQGHEGPAATGLDPLDPLEMLPTVTEIIDGPVAPLDRVYAFDRVRDACRTSRRRVRRAHLRLVAQPLRSGRGPVVAEGTLVLDGGVVVCAGVVAATLRAAVDDLAARIRRRMRDERTLDGSRPLGAYFETWNAPRMKGWMRQK